MLSEFLSSQEIDTLKCGFEYVFKHIADSDDKVDKKENAAFVDFIKRSKNLTSNAAIEILSNYDIEKVRSIATNSLSTKENLKKVALIVDAKLDREEAVEFKKSLIAFGYYVANSSGSFFDHKVSHDEEDALNEIGFAIGLSVKDVITSGVLENILVKLG